MEEFYEGEAFLGSGGNYELAQAQKLKRQQAREAKKRSLPGVMLTICKERLFGVVAYNLPELNTITGGAAERRKSKPPASCKRCSRGFSPQLTFKTGRLTRDSRPFQIKPSTERKIVNLHKDKDLQAGFRKISGSQAL
jgi:hypothetical protein